MKENQLLYKEQSIKIFWHLIYECLVKKYAIFKAIINHKLFTFF